MRKSKDIRRSRQRLSHADGGRRFASVPKSPLDKLCILFRAPVAKISCIYFRFLTEHTSNTIFDIYGITQSFQRFDLFLDSSATVIYSSRETVTHIFRTNCVFVTRGIYQVSCIPVKDEINKCRRQRWVMYQSDRGDRRVKGEGNYLGPDKATGLTPGPRLICRLLHKS